MAVCQATSICLNDRYREQARSYRGMRCVLTHIKIRRTD